ncbi:MAG: histidine phosphatase family protein [Patescibacteria group bacterium]
MAKTTLYFVRHGESLYNAKGVIQGHVMENGNTLSETGKHQAKNLKQKLSKVDFHAFLSSPSIRALETCKIISDGQAHKIVIIDDLREKGQGAMAGMKKTDIKKFYANWSKMSDDENLDFKAFPDEESQRELRIRVLKTINEIVKSHEGKTVLIATHGGYMRSIYNFLKEISFKRPMKFQNCGYLKVEHEDGKLVVTETEKLKELSDDEFFGIKNDQ